MNPTSFERALEAAIGLPNNKATRPVTKLSTIPIIGSVTTSIVQSVRDESGTVTIFLQVATDGGLTQVIIPPDVAAIIYRQRDALKDRSTPASRQRKASKSKRERERKERAERAAAYARRKAIAAGCTPERADWVASCRRLDALTPGERGSRMTLDQLIQEAREHDDQIEIDTPKRTSRKAIHAAQVEPRTDIAHAKRRGE